MNDVIEAAKEFADREDQLSKVLHRLYGLEEKQNADYQAVASVAIDCALKLFNVLRSARKREGVHKGYMDLVVGLNNNPFWAKHGAAIIPLLHTALQAQADYAVLMMEKLENPRATHSDGLIAESQLIGIEIFVLIAFCIGGQQFMTLKAIEIKKALAPYFME